MGLDLVDAKKYLPLGGRSLMLPFPSDDSRARRVFFERSLHAAGHGFSRLLVGEALRATVGSLSRKHRAESEE